MVQVTTCPACNGRGETITTPCRTCNGRGLERKSRRKVVTIPGGVDTGTQIRLAGEGQPGINGGPLGNLYLVIDVQAHKFFRRRGNDVLLDLNINIAQATLGAEVGIPTVTLYNGGVFYSTNEGNTWKPAGLHEKSVQAVCSNESNSILAGTSDGVYYLPDFDSSWIPSGLPNTSILCLERAPNGDVFAGTIESGLYLSPDNGISWSFVGLLNKSIRSIMTDNSQTIYAGTENEGIYRSLDGGINWQFLGLANTSNASLAQASLQIFAATNFGIYKSTDNGTSWSFTGLNGNSVQELLVSPINYIYAATSESGVYYSENYGQSWTQLNSGLNHLNVKSLSIDSNGFLYAGTDYGGVYSSAVSVPVELTSFSAVTNGKEVILNWSTATELNNQLFEVQRSFEGSDFATVGFINGKETTTERQDYSYSDEVFTNGKYSYRLKQIDYLGSYEYSDIVEIDFKSFNSYLLEQNYPNPFNPTTTIGFGIQNKSNVKITILNSIGEEVAVVLNEEREAGFYQVEFNATSLPR